MSVPTLPEGTVVAGKLRIVRLLGAGGMGAVYEVEHEFTKHRRALKLLHPEMLQHPFIVQRFLREASAAGRIGNEHIVETFDAGNLESGEPYLVMEMLQGRTLADRLAQDHHMALDQLADIIIQACDGVQAAHTAGIVHRDLKPENIFLIDTGEGELFVKLLDFGISKFDPSITGGYGVTKEGSALGTPFYMSPEQVSGNKDLDARTDIYALGVILYECSSGERPFIADALPRLSILIHEGTPRSVKEHRPELPDSFVEVVHKAMHKDPDQRFASARDLSKALAPFGNGAMDSTLPERPSSEMRSARSEPPRPSSGPPGASSSPSKPPSVRPKVMAASMAGAALSIHDEKKSRERKLVWAVVGAGALVTLGVVGVTMSKSDAPASGLVTPTPAVPLPPAEPATDPTASAPVASASAPPAAQAPVASATPDSDAAAPSASAAHTTPPKPAKPAAGPRVGPRDIDGVNPYR